MAILLKTSLVRVSSIQIMQVRVQNKGKSVWKSRYDGDISLEQCRTQLAAVTAELGKSKEAPIGKVAIYPENVIMCQSCLYN